MINEINEIRNKRNKPVFLLGERQHDPPALSFLHSQAPEHDACGWYCLAIKRLIATHHNARYAASNFTELNKNRENATAFRGRPGIPGAVVRTGRAINARLIASYRLRRLRLAVAPLRTPVGDTGRDASRPAARG